MKNKIIGVLVVVILILVGVFATQSRKSSEAIKIGGLYPLTGGLASYGEPAFNVARIAVDEINADGGINGRKLELVAEDHQCDPKVAVSAFKKLVNSDQIHILTSVACTGTVMSIVPELETTDSVLLGTVTSGNKLTGVSPNFFRNWASDGLEAKLLAAEIIKKGYKNVAVIYEETDYAKGLKISLDDYLKGTDVKVSSESFNSGATDVRSQLTKLQALKADVLFVSVQTVPSGELVLTQMEQLKFTPRAMFVNDNIVKAASLVKNHAQLLEGAIGGDYVFPDSAGLNEILVQYKTRYGVDCPQINICGAEYDAVKLLAQAMREKGATAKGVKEYLTTQKYDGVSGTISFDGKNDRSGAEYSLFVVKEGKVGLKSD